MARAQTFTLPLHDQTWTANDLRLEGISLKGNRICGFRYISADSVYKGWYYRFDTSAYADAYDPTGNYNQAYACNDVDATYPTVLGRHRSTHEDFNAWYHFAEVDKGAPNDHDVPQHGDPPSGYGDYSAGLGLSQDGSKLVGIATYNHADFRPSVLYPGDTAPADSRAVIRTRGSSDIHVVGLVSAWLTTHCEAWAISPEKDRIVGAYDLGLQTFGIEYSPCYYALESGAWVQHEIKGFDANRTNVRNGVARATNSKGTVAVGWLEKRANSSSPYYRHPFKWLDSAFWNNPSNLATDLLSTLPAISGSNQSGTDFAVDYWGYNSVGWYSDGTTTHAFLNTPFASYDLNSLSAPSKPSGYVMEDATAISGTGTRICGNSSVHTSVDGVYSFDPYLTYSPTTSGLVTVVNGTLLSQVYANLATPGFADPATGNAGITILSDDNLLGKIQFKQTIASLSGVREFYVVVTSSAARTGLSETVSLYNYSTSTWDSAYSQEATTAESVKYTYPSSSTRTQYRSSTGETRAQIEWHPINDESPDQDGWGLNVSFVQWRILP